MICLINWNLQHQYYQNTEKNIKTPSVKKHKQNNKLIYDKKRLT